MILDAQHVFSNDQTLVASAGNVTSTNVINLGDAEKGKGKEVMVDCRITTAVTSASTDCTVNFKLVTALDAALTSSSVILYQTGAIGKASLVAGYRAPIRSLPEGCKQYLGWVYTIVSAAGPTAGKVHSCLTIAKQTNE